MNVNLSEKYRRKRKFWSTVKYLFMSLYAIVNIYPFFWLITNSFKDTNDILMHPLGLPRIPHYINYILAWSQAGMYVYFFNTILVTFVAVILILLLSAMIAYVIARVLPSGALYAFFIVGLMIPIHALIIPNFFIVSKLGLLNTRLSLVMVYIGVHLSLSFFILYGFIKETPVEIEDAAFVDGCSRYRTFFHITLPLIRPALATVGILAVLLSWNEYLIPLVLVSNPAVKVLSQGIQELKGFHTTDYGILFSGLVIATIPVVVFYIAFQENVIKGMIAGAVKA
jgi:raffinose/stachyose/melibiose transport system permease protein